jgi:hypothetical protein
MLKFSAMFLLPFHLLPFLVVFLFALHAYSKRVVIHLFEREGQTRRVNLVVNITRFVQFPSQLYGRCDLFAFSALPVQVCH